MLRRQQMIDDVEAPLAARPIDRGNVDQIAELAARVVAQKAHDRDDVGGLRRDGQFVIGDRIAGHRGAERASDRFAERVERLIHGQRSIVAVRRIFFCSSSTPYSSASAVGGQPGT